VEIRAALEPIAAWFNGLGIPMGVVRWGHPAMMAIVVFAMGTFVGLSGWRSRVLAGETAVKERSDHRKLAPAMFAFMAAGATGGLLSLVMQGEPILDSPHFWSGMLALGLLAANGTISLAGFAGGRLRTVHAYLGSVALGVMFLHALFGLRLGFDL